MRVFADVKRLAEFLDEVPENAERLLKRASLLVAMETRAALFECTPAGLPTEPDVIDAFGDATCLQVVEWVLAGVDPDLGVSQLAGGVKKSALDGASVEYETLSEEAVERMCSSLCPSAVAVLVDAGLVGGLPWAY